MQIFRELNIDKAYVELAANLVENINPIMMHKYDKTIEYSNNSGYSFVYRVGEIMCLSGKKLEGLVVLDLGCGTRHTKDEPPENRQLEPWLSRVLYELGAKPIGIDHAEFGDEEFEHHQLDLYDPDSLSHIPDSSVDIAFAFNLFDSPTLCLLHGDKYKYQKRLYDLIVTQLERILKPEGVFVYTPTGYF